MLFTCSLDESRRYTFYVVCLGTFTRETVKKNILQSLYRRTFLFPNPKQVFSKYILWPWM